KCGIEIHPHRLDDMAVEVLEAACIYKATILPRAGSASPPGERWSLLIVRRRRRADQGVGPQGRPADPKRRQRVITFPLQQRRYHSPLEDWRERISNPWPGRTTARACFFRFQVISR